MRSSPTIMLNYIAALVVFFALRSPTLRAAGSTSPVSKNLTPIVDVPNIINLRTSGSTTALSLRC